HLRFTKPAKRGRLAARGSLIVDHKSQITNAMAAIGRFQKDDEIFHAKVVDGKLFRLRGDVFGSPSFDKEPTPHKGVKTLVPVVPSKIIAVGVNYLDHAREMQRELPKEPLIWLKAPTSLLPDGGKIEIPFPQHRTDFEAELAIVSDRNIQKADGQWARAKSFDTFTPLGPFVETQLDSAELSIQQFQNGQLRQN